MTYLVYTELLAGLKVHGELLKLSGGTVSTVLVAGGELLLLEDRISVSFIVASERGDRATEPGVMDGSSSTDLICVP